MTKQELPYSEDAEQAVLSAILIDPEAINTVASSLPVEAFYLDRHQRIYAAMRSLHQSGKTIDPITLMSELGQEGQSQRDYISSIYDTVPTGANIEYHAGILKKDYSRRVLVTLMRDTLESALDPDFDVTALAAQVQQQLLPIAVGNEGKGYLGMFEIMRETLEMIEARGEASRLGRLTGVGTGYPEIDDATSGFRDGEMVSIFGGPKCGKTALTLCIALHNSLNGDGCGFVCAEMTRHALAERCLNAYGRIKTSETARGLFGGDGLSRVARAGGEIAAMKNFFIDDEAFPELGDVISRALHLKSQQPKLKLIVVDYLQLVTHRIKGRRGDEEINEICKGLKGLAKRAEVTIVAPGQTNFKEVDARSVPKPTMRDIQGASGPAQTSDFLFLASRPNMNDPLATDYLELELAASRRTARFTTQLIWNGPYMRVESPRAIQFGRTTQPERVA